MEGNKQFKYVKKDDRNQQKKQEKPKEMQKAKSKSPKEILSDIWTKGNGSSYIDSHVHLDLINEFEKEKKNEIKEESWEEFKVNNFGTEFRGDYSRIFTRKVV